MWRVLGSNQRRLSRRFYRPLPLATRATRLAAGWHRREPEIHSPWRGSEPGSPVRRGSSTTQRRRYAVADASFDVVSKVDRQEVDNALNQAAKELSQRFDFRGTNAGSHGPASWGDHQGRHRGARRRRRWRSSRRSWSSDRISLKSLDAGDPKQSGKQYVIAATLKQGIDSDHAKKIAKLVRDEGPKGVQAQIQGDQLRVCGKKKDDLQAVIALLQTPTSMSPCSSSTIGRGHVTDHEGHHPGRRLRHPAASAHPRDQQAAAAGLRQADDLLPAVDADAGRASARS